MKTYDDIGLRIDAGLDTRDPNKIHEAISEIDALLISAEGADHPVLYYFRANAYSNLRQLRPDYLENQFAWQQPEYSEEIVSLRRSIRCSTFDDLGKMRQCQIYTNLGNAFNTIGRPIEAIAAWDQALKIVPSFAMAAANRASGLAIYSAAFYDEDHQCVFLKSAAEGFFTALSPSAIWDGNYPASVRQQFQAKLEEIAKYLSVKCRPSGFDTFNFEIGRNAKTVKLNQWRLDQRLFLNPLNDLGALPVAAHDIFHLPNHSYNLEDETPRFVKYFDLLKDEYVAACLLLFEGSTQDLVHDADKTNLIFEHGDYSITGIGIEKQKMAFRMAYSLLDKCAVFINDYFQLAHNSRSLNTSFRKVWFDNYGKRLLNSKLPAKNWRLRGLYAISIDLFEEDFSELSSPLAVKANELRNAAEHRFISVHEFGKPEVSLGPFEYVTRDELSDLALHMLKLSRATIMGLSLAVHHQEKCGNQQRDDKLIVPFLTMPKRR